MDNRKIKSFTDLKAWREAHVLAISVYRLTEKFPQNEQFGLCSQLKRAASSVTSNIAEGFGRSSSKDKEHFYTMATGSLYEIKSQLILAKDLKFISQEDFISIADEANIAHKLLNSLLKAHKSTTKASNV
jgi:four helix bundle protein